jgi:hypothetical protein
MAITKTDSVSQIQIYPLQENRLKVVRSITLDDPDDDSLPLQTSSSTYYDKLDSEGNATDMSSTETIVQTVATAVWAD